MSQIVENRKKAWKDFYAGERNMLVSIQRDYGFRPWPFPENRKERIEYALDMYRAQMDALEWLDDDRVPYLSPYSGTEIFARAFGCQVHKPENDMPFALPMIHSSEEVAKLKVPSLEAESLQEIFSIADALHQAEPDAVMALPDIQSPLDIAALIWEKSDFFAAMLEEPEAIMEVVSMAQQLLCDFLDEWFSRYGTEFISHYPDYYMPCGVTMSEDEVGTISSSMFEEFSLEGINALSKRYGGVGIHCCANSSHQWGSFAKIQDLKMVNLVQPPEVLEKAYPFFKNICGQMNGFLQIESVEGTLRTNTMGLSKDARIVLQGFAHSKEEAIAMAKSLRELAEKYESMSC